MIKSLRIAAAAAVLTGLAIPAAASAAHPHYTCNLITDPKGDTQGPTPDDPQQLDITGGDIAANDHELTVVIRLAALADEQPTNAAGRLYQFYFTVGATDFMAQARLLTGGADFEASKSDVQEDAAGDGSASSYSGIGAMTGIVDTQAKEIRMSAPLSVFTAYAHFDNAPMKNLGAGAFWARGVGTTSGTGPVTVGGPSVGVSADFATSHKTTYLDWPSCVRIGHCG